MTIHQNQPRIIPITYSSLGNHKSHKTIDSSIEELDSQQLDDIPQNEHSDFSEGNIQVHQTSAINDIDSSNAEDLESQSDENEGFDFEQTYTNKRVGKLKRKDESGSESEDISKEPVTDSNKVQLLNLESFTNFKNNRTLKKDEYIKMSQIMDRQKREVLLGIDNEDKNLKTIFNIDELYRKIYNKFGKRTHINEKYTEIEINNNDNLVIVENTRDKIRERRKHNNDLIKNIVNKKKIVKPSLLSLQNTSTKRHNIPSSVESSSDNDSFTNLINDNSSNNSEEENEFMDEYNSSQEKGIAETSDVVMDGFASFNLNKLKK